MVPATLPPSFEEELQTHANPKEWPIGVNVTLNWLNKSTFTKC
jgi:hypothetical protein